MDYLNPFKICVTEGICVISVPLYKQKAPTNTFEGAFCIFMDCYLDAILMSLGVRNSKKRSNQPLLDS